MSYFDNANTDVTRRSFGSKVDKTFQREGVIPVKDRKKEERDLVAESAKYKELNKKVDERRMKEAKDARAYEVQLREGYETLKDELIKDFLSEICVESLLVDRPVVECNLKNITDMVEEKVDEIGGFKGIKHIAESTNNGLLKNIVGICEATCKKVGERNLKEAKGNPSLLDMKLNKIEMEEFGNRKKEIGSETIINHIKDKVFQVVKDEQEMNTNRQEIMSEIENKVMDLNGPVQEAMEYIFESQGVEESTLFNSLMRSHYKQILQNESSAIFESMDIPGDDEEDFEDQEFAMGDIELVDEESDEEIEDMFLKEAIELLAKARYVGTEEVVSEAFNEVISRLNESVKSVRSKSDAIKVKNTVKQIQYTLEEGFFGKLKEKRAAKKAAKEEKYNQAMLKELVIVDENKFSQYEKEFNSLVEYMISILKREIPGCTFISQEIKHSEKVVSGHVIHNYSVRLFDLDNGDNYKKFIQKSKNPDLKGVENEESYNYVDEINQDTFDRIGKPLESKGYSYDENRVFSKGVGGKDYIYVDLGDETMFQVYPHMTIAVKKDVVQESTKVPSDPEQPDMSLAKPEKGSKKVEEEVILCPTCGKEECKCKVAKESFETQLECLDVYYTQMNKIIESHEMALNNVTESLRHEIDGKETMVPYLQTKDCNLNNLELGYKTKYVCESIKAALKEANDVNDMAILERVVELNISSLTESINLLKERTDMDSKVKILKTGRKYLGRLQEVINGSNLPYADPVTESTEVFNSADDVDRVFNMVKEYYVVESTDKDLMEMVMAEAIVEYTIMEAFNTLRLINYTKDSVRQIARKNISK